MTPRATLRQAGLFSLLTCAASGYFVYIDRHTPLGMSLVEAQSSVPVPIPALFALLGIGLISVSTRQNTTAPKRNVVAGQAPKQKPLRTPTRTGSTEIDPKAQRSLQSTGEGWDQIRISCNQIELPPGATIHLDRSRPCPIQLRMEMATPERCKRAIQNVAEWFSVVSVPPRFRIEFTHCPEDTSPRHHVVNGAIAQHIPRGDFKVVADRDAVDVIFHRPDKGWKNPDPTG